MDLTGAATKSLSSSIDIFSFRIDFSRRNRHWHNNDGTADTNELIPDHLAFAMTAPPNHEEDGWGSDKLRDDAKL